MPQRPRVVILNSVARLSGAELALLRTAPALLPHVDLTVVLAEDGPLVPKLQEAGVDVRLLRLADSVRTAKRDQVTATGLGPRTAWLLAVHIWRIRRLLRSERADVVHCNNLKSSLYGGLAGRLAGVPVVWHLRDRIADDYLPRPAVVLVRLLARVLPSAIIANSNATLQTVPPRRRSSVLGSPIVPDSVESRPHVDRENDGQLVVGMVGRLSPWKGQDVFLRAFAEAFPDGYPAQARLVGSAMFGEDHVEGELRALCRDLGISDRVEFRGFREDVWAELSQFDIAVHASTSPEPFGQVVLEAMAAGVPVVAADEGGPAEVVTPDVDGLLFAPRDPHALAQALRRLVDEPGLAGRLAEAGPRTASAYSPERTAEGVLEAYRSVLR